MRWPEALKGDVLDAGGPALPACPSWPRYLYPCLSIPRGRCQSAMGAFPFFSIAFPQQGHEGASFDISLPGTVRICTTFLHLLPDVPSSSVQTLSLGSPACTKPTRWEGIRKKTESSPAWEIAGSWADGDATLVIALHPCSGSSCCDARF